LKKESFFTKENLHMNTYVIFDIETTGFGHSAEIIELAALKIIDGKVSDTFESFVKPSNPIPTAITALTHITNEMVENAPYIDEILPAFLYFIENYKLVGHNIASFDLPFIRRLLLNTPEIQLKNDYIDTLYMAKHKLTLNDYKLTTIANHLQVDVSNAHRAMKDCYITFECFSKLLQLPDIKTTSCAKTNATKHTTLRISEQTKALQTLNGFIMGIISDAVLSDKEILSLNDWMNDHTDLMGQYPFDKVFHVLERILADGTIDEAERHELLSFFNEMINPVEKESSSVREISFEGKTFCLTGEFDFGEKSQVASAIERLGGSIERNVKKNLDFLIVGNKGSENWSSENYGGKVKKALEYNDKGCHISIIRESDIKF